MKWWQFTKNMFMRYCEMHGFKTIQITETSMFGSRPCPQVCLSTNPNCMEYPLPLDLKTLTDVFEIKYM